MTGLPEKDKLDEISCRFYEGIEYRDFWKGTTKQMIDVREKIVVSAMLPETGRRIIDVGCGYGRLAGCYAGRYEQIVMLDGSLSLLQQAREETGGKLMYIASNLERMPFVEAAFDTALMVRVFHHLEQPEEGISELRRILCNQGQLFFNYRNKGNIMQILKYVFRKTIDSPYSHNPVEVNPLFYHHNPQYVRHLLHERSFEERRYLGTGLIDKIPLLNRLALFVISAGIRTAPFWGKNRLAQWLFCQALLTTGDDLAESDDLANLLRCPECYRPVVKKARKYLCSGCDRGYPVVDGVIDFRL